jgi:hypothetical protein
MPHMRIVTFAILSGVVVLAQPMSAEEVAKQDQKMLKAPSASKPLNKKGLVGLNPQPEPPSQAKKGKLVKPGEMRGLNPQPEPPSVPRK